MRSAVLEAVEVVYSNTETSATPHSSPPFMRAGSGRSFEDQFGCPSTDRRHVSAYPISTMSLQTDEHSLPQ